MISPNVGRASGYSCQHMTNKSTTVRGTPSITSRLGRHPLITTSLLTLSNVGSRFFFTWYCSFKNANSGFFFKQNYRMVIAKLKTSACPVSSGEMYIGVPTCVIVAFSKAARASAILTPHVSRHQTVAGRQIVMDNAPDLLLLVRVVVRRPVQVPNSPAHVQQPLQQPVVGGLVSGDGGHKAA